MKLVVFDEYALGVVVSDGARDAVVDVSHVLPERWRGTPVSMNVLASDFEARRPAIDEAVRTSSPVPLESVSLRPPVPAPRHVIAAPGNYVDHVSEMAGSGERSWVPPRAHTARDLGLFLKSSGSIVGPADEILLPPNGRLFHHEAELAVVIGRDARGAGEEQSLEHVFGVTCLIDVTMRTDQAHSEDRSMRKSFETFTPIGPALVTVDELPDLQDLGISLWVNGELRQKASTRDMTVPIPELISLASSVFTLRAGDVIATGTPAGVGPLVAGDEVSVEIERVGRLTLPVAARPW